MLQAAPLRMQQQREPRPIAMAPPPPPPPPPPSAPTAPALPAVATAPTATPGTPAAAAIAAVAAAAAAVRAGTAVGAPIGTAAPFAAAAACSPRPAASDPAQTSGLSYFASSIGAPRSPVFAAPSPTAQAAAAAATMTGKRGTQDFLTGVGRPHLGFPSAEKGYLELGQPVIGQPLLNSLAAIGQPLVQAGGPPISADTKSRMGIERPNWHMPPPLQTSGLPSPVPPSSRNTSATAQASAQANKRRRANPKSPVDGNHSSGEEGKQGTWTQNGEAGEGGYQPGAETPGTEKQRLSSHVLTEQRRRNRINDRFSTLRLLVPHSEKTDKASFLQEVITYIRTLQTQISGASPMDSPPASCLPTPQSADPRGESLFPSIAPTPSTQAPTPQLPGGGATRSNADSGAGGDVSVIKLSSTYQQGLLDHLTNVLQQSGVDVGKATINVQIDLNGQMNSSSLAAICSKLQQVVETPATSPVEKKELQQVA